MAIFSTNNFSGGMNDFVHPSLLDEKTASLLVDATVENGKIVPVRRPRVTQFTTPTQFGHYGTADNSVVKWYGRYYWSNNAALTAPFYGGNIESLGIPYPLSQPTLVAASPGAGETGLSGRYRYCICYVNANGWEGAPSAIEDTPYAEITLDNQFVTVTANAFPDGISYAKVYRTGASGADFYCVGEIHTSAGTLLDKTSDTTLTLLEAIDTVDNYPPPDGGKFLSEAGGVFFLAVGSNLYFTRQNNPHAWPKLQFIGFDDDITGISPEFQGILVFTRNNAYRVIGAEDPETITKVFIPGNQGCVNFRSISFLNNMPVWLSNDGLCVWDGNNLSVITNGQIQAKNLQVRCATSCDDVYYLFHAGGAIVFDQRFGVFRKLSFVCNYCWYDSNADRMYMQIDGYIYVFGEGKKATFKYKSPLIGNSEITQKRFLEFAASCSEEYTLTIFLDGNQAFKKNIPFAGRQRIKLPFSMLGRHAQVQIESSGELTEIAMVYM